MSRAARPRVLVAGEDPPPGSGRYLLALLAAAGAAVTHVPSGRRLTVRRRYDAFIFSDFARADAPAAAQQAIARQVAAGAGLLMIGGWGSFAAPFGRWRGSVIERLLPVACLPADDRRNAPQGAVLEMGAPHAMWGRLAFEPRPVICGWNAVRPRAGSRVLLRARPLRIGRGERFCRRSHPLFVVQDRGVRTAALTTDVAPHWCGGLVDWGGRRVRIRVGQETVECWERYVAWFARIVRWLTGR